MSTNITDIDNVTSSTLWSLNYSLPEMAVVTAMLAAMIVITACGNALVVIALVRVRSLRSVSNMLIGNLAVSDFLLAVIVLPLSTVNECLGRWPLGHVACNIWLTVDVLCCTASIWNLCMIAVDRCKAVVYPLSYRHKRSVRHAVPYVAAVWLVSAAVSAPPSLLGWGDVYFVDDDSEVYQCVLYQSPGYVIFSASASFFVPFSITVMLYVRIFALLLQRVAVTKTTTDRCSRRVNVVAGMSTRTLPDGASLCPDVEHCDDSINTEVKSTVPSRNTSLTRGRLSSVQCIGDEVRGPHIQRALARYRQDHKEMIVSVRMAVIVVVFGGMWLGFFVLYVIHSCCSTCYIPRQLDAFFFWLGYANSSVNPILYTIFNADFRRAIRNIVAVCRCP